MSRDSVQSFLATFAPDITIIDTDATSATVAEAAAAHNVEPAQIAKTLGLWLGDELILIVMSGSARIDNQKYRAQFGQKARMAAADELFEKTSHPVGGVCPFGLPVPLRVYADQSLKAFPVIIPAAGGVNCALKIAPTRLVELTGAEWVDIAQ
jgi:prolyl-tRNA editing enzyme YbaK/EbsC (Cys-tRNA(Pro) deacylase)